MTRPGLIALDPALLTDFVFEVDEGNILTYRLWIRKRDGNWCAVGPEDTDQAKAHHWLFVPPLQVDGAFAYSFSVWGHPNFPWEARITVRQRAAEEEDDSWCLCGSWIESGTLDDEGCAGAVGRLGDATRVRLATATSAA
jgi:hypothetical protein